MLEVENTVAAAHGFLRRKACVKQQRAGLATDFVVGRRQLQMIPLGRVCDRAARQKRAAQKSQPLVVLLKHAVVDMQRDVARGAQAELREDLMDLFLRFNGKNKLADSFTFIIWHYG